MSVSLVRDLRHSFDLLRGRLPPICGELFMVKGDIMDGQRILKICPIVSQMRSKWKMPATG